MVADDKTIEGLVEAVHGLTTSVEKLISETAKVEKLSNRRAVLFRRLWVGLATFMFLVAALGTWGYFAERANRECFQDWANRTAVRSQLVSVASDRRVTALNDVLQSRARGDSEERVRYYAGVAARAGLRYETLIDANPPIPPEALRCTD